MIDPLTGLIMILVSLIWLAVKLCRVAFYDDGDDW